MTTPPLTETTILTRALDALSTELDGEGVILDMESGLYFGLDSVAQRIWELCKEPVQLQSIVTQITAEFEVDHHQCQQDVLFFINDMLANKLLKRQSPE